MQNYFFFSFLSIDLKSMQKIVYHLYLFKGTKVTSNLK